MGDVLRHEDDQPGQHDDFTEQLESDLDPLPTQVFDDPTRRTQVAAGDPGQPGDDPAVAESPGDVGDGVAAEEQPAPPDELQADPEENTDHAGAAEAVQNPAGGEVVKPRRRTAGKPGTGPQRKASHVPTVRRHDPFDDDAPGDLNLEKDEPVGQPHGPVPERTVERGHISAPTGDAFAFERCQDLSGCERAEPPSSSTRGNTVEHAHVFVHRTDAVAVEQEPDHTKDQPSDVPRAAASAPAREQESAPAGVEEHARLSILVSPAGISVAVEPDRERVDASLVKPLPGAGAAERDPKPARAGHEQGNALQASPLAVAPAATIEQKQASASPEPAKPLQEAGAVAVERIQVPAGDEQGDQALTLVSAGKTVTAEQKQAPAAAGSAEQPSSVDTNAARETDRIRYPASASGMRDVARQSPEQPVRTPVHPLGPLAGKTGRASQSVRQGSDRGNATVPPLASRNRGPIPGEMPGHTNARLRETTNTPGSVAEDQRTATTNPVAGPLARVSRPVLQPVNKPQHALPQPAARQEVAKPTISEPAAFDRVGLLPEPQSTQRLTALDEHTAAQNRAVIEHLSNTMRQVLKNGRSLNNRSTEYQPTALNSGSPM
jgi:hypothetical protein